MEDFTFYDGLFNELGQTDVWPDRIGFMAQGRTAHGGDLHSI